MPAPVRSIGIAGLLAVMLCGLYTTRLSFAPVYLIHDEVKFALQAQAIAATGRDLNGRLLPVYFSEPEFPAGRDPVVIYLTALFLQVLPLSEFAVRLPTALAGVLNGLLMFALARRLFKSEWMGVAAAALLALTPAHFMNSRLALSMAYPLPFILGWLTCLNWFQERRKTQDLVLGAVLLSLGVYSYLACVVMMPVYLVLTGLVVPRDAGWWPAARRLMLAFALPLVPILLWQLAYPSRYMDLIAAYRLHSAQPGSPADAGGGVLSYEALRLRVSLFWTFFSPDFLFISGDSSLINSTRHVGFFPLACAVLMPVGVLRLIREREGFGLVILLGLVSAPLAGVMSGQLEVNRLLFVIPFGVLAAMYGLDELLSSRTRWRWTAVALVATVPWQFSGFYRDYMGAYRGTSSVWLGGNLRGALLSLIERTPEPPAFYVGRIPYADAYWRFYALAAGRPDLIDRPTYVDEARGVTEPVPAGALMVTTARATPSAEWEPERAITEPNGEPSFMIFRRRGPPGP